MNAKWLLTALACFVLAAGAARGEITEQQFQSLHKQLRPGDDEPWRTIPWRISLLDAQRIAAEEKKPIFIWAMDGHPLGCT